jgi:cyclohexyl-isocyanide hydratase
MRESSVMEIAFLIFDRLTMLDAIGPYEVLQRLPGAEIRFVATEAGEKRDEQGHTALVADHTLADVTSPDVLVIPGGFGNRPLLQDETVLDWVRSVHETTRYTTSVCTGALVLGAAGLLKGKRATTHWMSRDMLRAFGAEPVEARVVTDGNLITGGGVTAGIDFALTVAAEVAGVRTAEAIQLGIEYAPAPPFNAGTPATADPALVKLVRERAAGRQSEREAQVNAAAAALDVRR